MCRCFQGHENRSLLSYYKSFLINHYHSSLDHVSNFLLNLYSPSSTFVTLTNRDETSSSNRNDSKNVWMLLCNAQSLFFKLDELRSLVFATKPIFACVTETWFTPDILDNLVQIPGFLLFRADRRDNPNDTRRGGGTAIYASISAKPSFVEIPPQYERPNGVEYSLISFKDPNMAYLLCAYVPPGLNADTFLCFRKHLTDVLDYVLKQRPMRIYMCVVTLTVMISLF